MTSFNAREAQIDALIDAATGAIRWSARQKCYLALYIYRAGKSAQHKSRAETTTYFYNFKI
jgi:hypothetical protein